MYKFLLKPGWIVLHILALMLAISFINLGFWQLRRLAERKENNALLQSRLALEPQPLETLLTTFQTDLPVANDQSMAYRPATIQGVYDTSEEVLWRTANNYNGEPGYYVLTPLVLADGRALIVDRGWVPFEMNKPPITAANPPEGTVELEGIVYPAQKRPTGFLSGLTPRDPPGELSVISYVDTERLAAQMPYQLLPVYLELHRQSPAQAGELPLPPQALVFSNGPHLGYAIQWFSFTLIGIIGYAFLIRQTARNQAKQS